MTAEPPQGDERAQVEALLRVNAELSAEIRNLALGRAETPRSEVAPAARRLSKLIAERDSLADELEQSRAELDAARQHNAELRQQAAAQTRHIEELGGEVARLRGGAAGILRRVRARLLRR